MFWNACFCSVIACWAVGFFFCCLRVFSLLLGHFCLAESSRLHIVGHRCSSGLFLLGRGVVVFVCFCVVVWLLLLLSCCYLVVVVVVVVVALLFCCCCFSLWLLVCCSSCFICCAVAAIAVVVVVWFSFFLCCCLVIGVVFLVFGCCHCSKPLFATAIFHPDCMLCS